MVQGRIEKVIPSSHHLLTCSKIHIHINGTPVLPSFSHILLRVNSRCVWPDLHSVIHDSFVVADQSILYKKMFDEIISCDSYMATAHVKHWGS